VLKIIKDEENQKILEKHLALTVMNKEKKQLLNEFNDKHRAKQVQVMQGPFLASATQP
jgi:hypothetical protein